MSSRTRSGIQASVSQLASLDSSSTLDSSDLTLYTQKVVCPTLDYEKSLWKRGYSFVCGIDEVGRGCFAGPVVVGAVIFPQGCELINGVADSKLLTPLKRQNLDPRIKSQAVSWAVAEVSVSIINKVGIGQATQIAFRKVVKLLSKNPSYILMDAFYIKHLNRKKQLAIVKGDQKSYSIAAASIIAKVHRDRLMGKLHKKYPQYGFGKHKGYGTKHHRQMIKQFGLSKMHRTSFNLQKFL